MRRSTVLLCFLLGLFNAVHCQLKADDSLACLFQESPEPCDHEQGCDFQGCSPSRCGLMQPQATPRLVLEAAEPLSFGSSALLSFHDAFDPSSRIQPLLDGSLRPRAGSQQQRLAWLQVFLC